MPRPVHDLMVPCPPTDPVPVQTYALPTTCDPPAVSPAARWPITLTFVRLVCVRPPWLCCHLAAHARGEGQQRGGNAAGRRGWSAISGQHSRCHAVCGRVHICRL